MGIGAELLRARNAAGLTHAELAAKTRIRAKIIEAVERDDFEACGGDVYARGHVKAIAVALGLDPKPLLAELGAHGKDTTFEQEQPGRLDIWALQERTRAPSEARSWLALVGVAAILLGALVYYVRATSDTGELVPAPEPSASAPSTPTALATATVTPEATMAATDAPLPTPPQETAATDVTGAIVLQFECTSSSWVRVTNDLGTLYEGTMRAGETKVLASDTTVNVRIGNAAGIKLTYNGTSYPELGGAGEVYSRTFPA